MKFLPQDKIPNFHVNSYLTGCVVMALLAFVMIRFPLRAAGAADEPPPPAGHDVAPLWCGAGQVLWRRVRSCGAGQVLWRGSGLVARAISPQRRL